MFSGTVHFAQVHLSGQFLKQTSQCLCDEWGGAESRGNGARPVEWMIMNDTCATHRSRVPRRSFGRVKRRSDDIGRRERTRPGFYFMFCVWQSSVRGCRFSVMFVYLIKCVWMFAGSRLLLPVYTNCVTLVPKPGRKEGHAVREPSLLSGIAVLRRSGSRKWRRPPVAARSGGAGAKEEQVGRKTRCRAPGSRRAVREGAEESPRSPGGRSLLPSAMFGEEQGTGDSLPAALDRRSHRRPPGGGWASGRPPKRSSTIAWHREWTAQLVEDRAAVCPGTGPRFFFFSPLSPLSSLSLLILPSPFSRLVCPYPQVRRGRPDGLPPGEGGGGE